VERHHERRARTRRRPSGEWKDRQVFPEVNVDDVEFSQPADPGNRGQAVQLAEVPETRTDPYHFRAHTDAFNAWCPRTIGGDDGLLHTEGVER
jgi:hypothetical protein